ncbi:MAG TPA: type II secretion system protein [Gallionellaceae bacterium]|nr:type II secretion system protein [Gallionellaceae bacterium]
MNKNAGRTNNYPPVPSAAAGFGYLALLLIIAIMGVVLVSTVQVWHMEMQRAKEQELLFVGDQFRRAINQYARHAQPGSLRFPMSLEDLLKDPRYPDTQRYLRKIYDDPISGSSKWGLLKGQSGEIFGIYSLSEEEPVKKHNFSLADASFEDRKKYSDWVFMSTPMRYSSRPSRKP